MGQQGADGIKQIGLMVKQGEAEDVAEASEQACGGDAEVEQIEQIVSALIQGFFESPQGDTFSHPCGAVKQGDASSFKPEVYTLDQFALSGGIEHLGGPHVLGERDLGESEVGLKMDFLLIHDWPPKS